MNPIIERISNIGIVPVVRIDNAEDSLPIAKALLDGGIDTMEITFRSEHTIHAMKEISKHYPQILIGAGTVSSVQQAKDAVEAGSVFIVTPGFNTEVVQWCVDNNVIVIPGIGTPTEIETALSYGITNMKLFPAATMGGDKFIKDISAPYPQVRIMPTGGINMNNMHDYLKLKNVIAIGGSFMLPNDLIQNKDWDALAALSKATIKAMLSLNTKTIQLPKLNTTALDYINEVSFKDEDQLIELSTPYLNRAHYHLAKQESNISESEDKLVIKDDNYTITIEER